MPVCEALGCAAEATTVIAGHRFCSNPAHRDGSHMPEVPIAMCAIAGCGSPAAARGLCRYHADHIPPDQAA